ncbi:MAG: hypothetical protein AABW79_03135 [Nanoarchaeota archaeon]
MGKIILVPSKGIKNEKELSLANIVFYRNLKTILENDKVNQRKKRRELLGENQEIYVRVSPLDFNSDYDVNSKKTSPLSFVSAETSITYWTDLSERGFANCFLTASCVDVPGEERSLELVESLKLGVKDCAFCVQREYAFRRNYSGKLFCEFEKAICDGDPGLCAADFNRHNSRLEQRADRNRILIGGTDQTGDLEKVHGKDFIDRLREWGYPI